MVKIKLAGICVEMDNRYSELENLCRGYETDEAAQLFLRVTPEEIEAERCSQTYDFSDGYLESICIYRKLALEMLQHNVFIMHASVVEVDGEGYAFLAPSGTGKTTQTRLWLEYFGSRASVINGDKPLVRMTPQGEFLAYGTPWCGKENMGCNASVPLKALFFLEHAPEPFCKPAPEEYSIDRLFQQLLMPESSEQMHALLTMTDRLIETVPSYMLHCNITVDSVKAAYEAAAAMITAM